MNTEQEYPSLGRPPTSWKEIRPSWTKILSYEGALLDGVGSGRRRDEYPADFCVASYDTFFGEDEKQAKTAWCQLGNFTLRNLVVSKE